MMSPVFRPAWAPGPPAVTAVISAPPAAKCFVETPIQPCGLSTAGTVFLGSTNCTETFVTAGTAAVAVAGLLVEAGIGLPAPAKSSALRGIVPPENDICRVQS